ncbi:MULTISPECIES: beta-galactosidase [Streptacidiphilus]|uniref:beta-galactosidase n=1 Tax=Streptacidiphilus cavernicola TaxID=3342716 RepID=A0ABV6URL8_9ACTN|nr:beta-galactosidase [Streptacidiphilus jeojiense]
MPHRTSRTLVAVAAAIAAATAGLSLPAAAHAAAPAATADVAVQAAVAKTPTPHTVSYDGYSLMIDGKRTYVWSGEFHYSRLPSPSLWLDVLQKMKAAGFNAVSIYFDWAYHSPKQGVYDFSGVRDVDHLLDLAAQVGIYVIARPGPYINAEVDSGGFPAWLNTLPGKDRSTDPTYLAAADEWLSRIDAILARHQLTNGTGTVIAYQVENEFYDGSTAGRAYMTHLEDKARADGITVPLTGNNNGTFNSGAGALDIDGADSYPQGFNCSNPTSWKGVPDISYDHVAGKPLYTAEFQGGSFDPWGGPGYAKCGQLTGADFASVFYKNNIAVGATMQSFYMTYGGTSWGWQADPSQVYTSYDYGAAISEDRQLTAKYQQDKLIGYFLQSVTPITKTDSLAAAPTDNAAIVDTARINPDDGTQFHVLRHANSTATSTDSTHIAIDLGAHAGYSYDDTATQLQYSGSWSHVGSEQSYTSGEYQRTESFTSTAGDSVSIPFTGTAIHWIASKAANHGLADVYLDGTKVATVDGYAASTANQQIQYSASGLSDGAHTLKIVATGQKDAAATGTFVSVDAVDLPTPGARYYPTVPQQPGTQLTFAGRDSKTIVANYKLGASQLQYSTSEIMTQAEIGGRDVAVLYGRQGQDGETVLNYQQQPTVQVLSGTVQSTWDASTGDLRLNYVHDGLARVLITGGARPLLLLLGTDQTAEQFWQAQTSSGPVLVYGSDLLRTATAGTEGRGQLDLTGDSASAQPVEVFADPAVTGTITWNGKRLQTRATSSGSELSTLPGAAAVTLPTLTDWKHTQESPESQPGFDDSSWQVADKATSNSTTTPATLPVLFADDYGFHHGDVWYRGRFKGSSTATGITLSAITGKAGVYSVWLNGTFLGSSSPNNGGTTSQTFAFPAGALKAGADNEVSVLVENMGHNEDYSEANSNKEARGLIGAVVAGSPLTTLSWRIQGSSGGEDLVDPVRGALNTGGLYGERAGWSLPGFKDSSWSTVSLPTSDTTPGVSWYRTTATLDLPKGQDTSVGLQITDDASRHYRALIYVNGWQLGRYVNDVGPQHVFPIPNGILKADGANTIAIAVWNTDGSTGGLGDVSLVNLGTTASSLRTATVDSPRYDAATYAQPKAHRATVTLDAPDTAAPGAGYPVTATFAVPTGAPAATAVELGLTLPSGWTAQPTGTVSAKKVAGGSTLTGSWTVTAPAATLPAFSQLTAVADYHQQGRSQQLDDVRNVRAVPVAPTADTDVSALPFFTSSNGWGPVERNTSNGEQAAGDGKPITIGGQVYASGLGTNAVSDVGIYLGGHCTRFTATVGVDAEAGTAGTVTFSVLADGRTLVTTPVLKGGGATVSIDVDTTGAQLLDLVVGDGGDGNGNDHADWADAKVVCS